MVEEITVDAHVGRRRHGYDIGPLVDAAQTPPFLTERRVVVGRHAGVFSTKDARGPARRLPGRPAAVHRRSCWCGRRTRGPSASPSCPNVPKSLTDAVTGGRGSRGRHVGRARARPRPAGSTSTSPPPPLRLDPGARKLIADHIGSEPGRLPGLLATLEGAFGAGAKVGRDDVEPYLGEAGDVAPWDLTDAIDGGDVPRALEVLHRMLGGGGRHPLQVMATLTNHYLRMIRSTTPRSAATRPRPRCSASRAAPSRPRRRSTGPAASARTAWPSSARCWPRPTSTCTGPRRGRPELVVEVLVARLAGRSRAARARR